MKKELGDVCKVLSKPSHEGSLLAGISFVKEMQKLGFPNFSMEHMTEAAKRAQRHIDEQTTVAPMDPPIKTPEVVVAAVLASLKQNGVPDIPNEFKINLPNTADEREVLQYSFGLDNAALQLRIFARFVRGRVLQTMLEKQTTTKADLARRVKIDAREVDKSLILNQILSSFPALGVVSINLGVGTNWFHNNYRALDRILKQMAMDSPLDYALLSSKLDYQHLVVSATSSVSSTPALAVRAAAAATAAGGGGPAPAASTVSVALPAAAPSAFNFAALSSALPPSSDGRITITISDTKTTRDVEVENDQSIASFFNSLLTWNAQFRDHTVYLQGKALSTAQTFRVAGVVAGTVLVLLPPQPAVAARVPLADQMKVGPDETFTVRETTSGQQVVVPYLRQHTLLKLVESLKPEVVWSKWRFEKDGVIFDVTKTLDALGIQAGDVLIVVARFFGGGPSVEASKPPEVSSEPAFIFGCDHLSWNATLQGKSNTDLKGWIDANGGKKKRQCLKANSKERLMQLAVEMQTARLESEEGTSTIVYEVQQPEGVGADVAAAGVVVPASTCLLFFLVQAIRNYEPGLVDLIQSFLRISGGAANAVFKRYLFICDATRHICMRNGVSEERCLIYDILYCRLEDTPYSNGDVMLAGWTSAGDAARARGEDVHFDNIADAEPEPQSSDDETYVPSDDAESGSESSDGGESGEDSDEGVDEDDSGDGLYDATMAEQDGGGAATSAVTTDPSTPSAEEGDSGDSSSGGDGEEDECPCDTCGKSLKPEEQFSLSYGVLDSDMCKKHFIEAASTFYAQAPSAAMAHPAFGAYSIPDGSTLDVEALLGPRPSSLSEDESDDAAD